MASIQRIESPLTSRISYRVQVRTLGFPSYSATFPLRSEAHEWALSTEAAIRENRFFPYKRAQRILFADLVARYRREVMHDFPLTKAQGREVHLAWWIKRFDGLSVAAINPEMIIEARDALVQEQCTRGPFQYHRKGSTANRYLSTLSHVLTIATKEWQFLDRNYVSDIRKMEEMRGRIRFLSSTERERLLHACSLSAWPLLLTLVLLAISTGARRGELIGLSWDQVDLRAEPPQISLRTSKNGDPRVLPLAGKALSSLRGLDSQRHKLCRWVFPQMRLDGPYQSFDPHWRVALKHADLHDFRFHDLRHTCASYLAEIGASFVEIASVLGHRDVRTAQRYAHLAVGHKSTLIERMVREHGL